jgi:enamine deaminase RidA (YjgF/YER057c/UK114 family)
MNAMLSKGIRSIHVERRLVELGYVLPPAAIPKGSFVNYKRVGNLVYLSGHLPQKPTEVGFVLGKVGKDVSVAQAQEAALYCALNICATLKHNLGDLDKVKGIVKLLALVNCTDDFTQQPAVVNGCSEAMLQVFGDKGAHARSALGTNSLPLGVPVEIEAIVEIEE